MRRFLAVNLLWAALACSSSGNDNDAAGTAGAGGGSAGTTGSAGTSGGAGTTGNGGTTGSGGRGGTTGSGGSGGGGSCLAFDAPGLNRGLACPNTNPACYGQCEFDGEQYVGCISGSPTFTQCYPSCGACP
jgi:hypothetical protein